MISDLQEFLNGHSEPIIGRIQKDMEKAAEDLKFERAAALRDRLKAMQSIVERQKVVFAADYKDSDVIAMARADNEACVQIFFIRGGKLIGREYFVLEGTEDTTDNEVMTEFVKQFYTEAANIPQQVMLPQEIEEAQIIGQWLRTRRGGGRWKFPSRAAASDTNLVKMAAENAPRPCRLSGRNGRRIHINRNRPWRNSSQLSCYRRRRTGWSATIFPIPREWPP